jgi:hypothetical protein
MIGSVTTTLKRGKALAAVVLTAFLMSASAARHEDIITGKLAFLAGEYDYIYSDAGKGKTQTASTLPDTYRLRITKKSAIILLKNGKKFRKYSFSGIRLDLLEEYDYVMFEKDNEYYPMFYTGDTVRIHIFPVEYDDNYFVKRK